MYTKHIITCFIVLCSISFGYTQRDIPEQPDRIEDQKAVYDYADVLTESQENTLNTKLIRYADTTSTQIVIATIESLQGEYIGTYAPKWAQKWGIGQKDKDNGLFILLARDDRKIWITTGYGLEEYMTDYTTKIIVDTVILPEFRAGSYYNGLDKGTTAIFQVLDGTFTETREQNNSSGSSIEIILFLLFIVIFIILVIRKRGGKGGKGGRKSGASLLDVIILSNMGSSGSSGGSFGGFGGSSGGFGGGFSGGFGGGGFGGGGAGGGW